MNQTVGHGSSICYSQIGKGLLFTNQNCTACLVIISPYDSIILPKTSMQPAAQNSILVSSSTTVSNIHALSLSLSLSLSLVTHLYSIYVNWWLTASQYNLFPGQRHQYSQKPYFKWEERRICLPNEQICYLLRKRLMKLVWVWPRHGPKYTHSRVKLVCGLDVGRNIHTVVSN